MVNDSSTENTPILAVDDDRGLLLSMKATLVSSGLPAPALVSEGDKVLDLVRNGQYHVILLDLVMPSVNGMDLLKEIKKEHPHIECIMITAVDEVSLAVQAIKYGAYDYLVKPVSGDKLSIVVRRALEKYDLRKGLSLYEKNPPFSDLKNPEAFSSIIAADASMARVFHQVEMVAATDYNLVITGESGTGKEMLARIIHELSNRSQNPFIPVNMAAFTNSLFEDEFFGHMKGAYTGAIDTKKGFFEAADGGTLFLDEIAELDPSLQGKLLRVLQEGTIYRVGSTDRRNVNVRILSATNKTIKEEITKETFRADLFYRLNMFQIKIPPLRERCDDIIPLTNHFLKLHAERNNKTIHSVSSKLKEKLLSYSFPGNVRELESIIASAVLIEKSQELQISSMRELTAEPTQSTERDEYLPTLDELERTHIRRALEITGQNRTKAAKMLGIGLRTLQRKIKEFDQK